MNTDANQIKHHPLELAAAGALVLYFVIKTCWFAFKISPALPPDEVTWFGISQLFSRSLLPPVDSPASYQFGLITHVPTFYFFLMGKLLHLNVTPVSDLVFLRLCNIAISMATLHCGWHLIRRLTDNGLIRILFLLMMTNTLMFTFLSASVSYDNLCNMLAAAAVYYAVRFILERRPLHLLFVTVALLLGGLTKISFLPFAFLLVVMLGIYECRRLARLPAAIKALCLENPVLYLPLFGVVIFLLALNVRLYLGNWLQYNALQAPMDKVVGLEAALQYRIFARDYIVRQFKQGKLSYTEAVRMTSIIKHQGDRNGALFLLQQALQEQAAKKKPRLDRFHYAFQWCEMVASRIYGVMGHRVLLKKPGELIPYYTIFLLALGLGIRLFSWQDLRGMTGLFLTVSAGYALIVMLLVNYRTYQHSGALVLALQGRYLFPVLVSFYALVAYYITARGSRTWQWLAAAGIAVVFLAGEFPWFLHHAGPEWFLPAG